VELVRRYAGAKGATPAQISLAWMLHKSPCTVPIPGSKNKDRIIENLDASRVKLTDAEFQALDAELGTLRVHGHRGFRR
jgi:aryl-alcohol dehydrogenase-like predicted oxidoreductase